MVTAAGSGWLTPAELGLSYRHSELRHGQVVLRAELRLRPRPPDEIKTEVRAPDPSAGTGKVAIELRDVNLSYGDNHVLHDITMDIGEKMGVLSHIASFWRFRFPDPSKAFVDAEELITILHDFSKGLPATSVEVV